MNRRMHIAVTALALGAAGLIGCKGEDNTTKTGGKSTTSPTSRAADAVGDAAAGIKSGADKMGAAIVGTGEKIAGAVKGADTQPADVNVVGAVVLQITNAAVTDDGLDDMVERFAKPDRDRIGSKKIDAPELNAKIDQLNKDWKAKYDTNLKTSDVMKALPNASVSMAPAIMPGEDMASVKSSAGVNMAGSTLRIPAGHDLPALDIPIVKEGIDAWKIDVPDSLDAAKLKDNVTRHLTMVGDMKDKWPADVNDAYSVLAHHVLMAVMDK